MSEILASRHDLETENEEMRELLSIAAIFASVHGSDHDELGVAAQKLLQGLKDLDIEIPQ